MKGRIIPIKKVTVPRSAWPLFGITALGMLPFITTNPYALRLCITLFMYMTLALSWNIMGGYTGYVSFGQAGLFGVGSYAAAILMVKYGFPFYLAFFLCLVATLAVALIIGLSSLKLRHEYFAIVTLGIAEVLRSIMFIRKDVTGGSEGLSLHAVFLSEGPLLIPKYYCFMIVTLVAFLTTYRIVKSDFGLRLMAIREDEDAAEVMGVDTSKYKILAFMISAIFAGAEGGLYAYLLFYISPFDAFSIQLSFLPILMVLFGGIGTVDGPIIGAVTMILISEYLRLTFLLFHAVILGALLLLVVLFMRGGIKGFLEKLLVLFMRGSEHY